MGIKMKNYINNNINFKILGIKNLIIFLSCILLFILLNLCMRPSISNVYFYTDIMLPILFSVTSIYLFKIDCTSNLNEVILIYNTKKYNKILFKRILEYILLSLLIIFLITIVLYYNIDKTRLLMEMPKNFFILFLKTTPNTIFLISFLLFILKITKNLISTYTIFIIFLFQEIGAKGTYTYPFNVFINFNSRTKFTNSLFIMNRFVLIVLSFLMIYYIVKKVNK